MQLFINSLLHNSSFRVISQHNITIAWASGMHTSSLGLVVPLPCYTWEVASWWCGLQESLQARPNSHELFGYDFVVDQALNVWLIEVNCSPSLEHSTPITARLCAQMMDDLFKV